MGAQRLALVSLVLASACGDGAAPSAAPSGPPVSELRVGLLEYRLQLSSGRLRAGPVTVVATNAGSTGHDVVLTQDGERLGGTQVLSPGRKQTVTVTVRPGAPVELECTVAGHAEAGMRTTMVVAEERR